VASYVALHQQSINDPEGFWGDRATCIDWHTPPGRILDADRLPFTQWFVGGRTNLCHNAIDRHLPERAGDTALIYVSTETGIETRYTFAELHAEVNRFAAIMQSLGVTKRHRVLIYLPMIPEAAFAMLACARIGAIHSVVFGGFASVALASRIDDATPTLIISADAGSRAGKVLPYKPLLDEAIALCRQPPKHVLLIDRGLAEMARTPGRDVDYAPLRAAHLDAQVPCVWLDSNFPSYILYTSGTTGKPKGIVRDVGGYAVALATAMDLIFQGRPGDVMFTASDIGWVVGHSFIVYGPLIRGVTTLMYEGTPIRPDGAIWWRLVEQYGVTQLFTAPTAIRVLKRQDPETLRRHDLSSLRTLFLAGEPLDEPTATWIADAIGKPVVDNYWQTESGWPMLAIARGIEDLPIKFGSPGLPVVGYDLRVVDEATGETCPPGVKGVVAVAAPLPPGCMISIWHDDARYVSTYWSGFEGKMLYSSFDWGVQDEDGYVFILGRTDDVINVAGHRLGTREIEESLSSHPAIAEVAVVGVADTLKGQVALAFAIVRNTDVIATTDARFALEGELMRTVEHQLGALARPSRVIFVPVLPKTRSGKLLRRAIQAVAEGCDPGDLTTIEDTTALDQLKDAMQRS
jgi:propionyl-CoA synthetase